MSWNIGALKKAPAATPAKAPLAFQKAATLVQAPTPAPEPAKAVEPLVEPPMCVCGRKRLHSTVEQKRAQCDYCILDAKIAEQERAKEAPPAPVEQPKKRRAVVDEPDDLWNQYLHGDALAGIASLPDKSIDHTITDPPYEEHTHTKALRLTGEGSAAMDDLGFGHITEAQRDEVAKHIVRVTKGWALVFCEDNAMHLWRAALEKHGAVWKRNCIWHKTNAMPKIQGDGPAQGVETFVAVWCGTGKSVWNRGGRSNHWAYPKEASEIHKTKKPLALMQDLVVSFTRPNEIILDVFAGSATTLIAAKQLGRRYIGWELDAKVHAAASIDLRNAREQLAMFRTMFAGDTTMRPGAFDAEAENGSRVKANEAQGTMFAALGMPEKVKKKRSAA